jgi:hypothetical protein
MSDQTHLLERIMGLQVELNHFGEKLSTAANSLRRRAKSGST